MFVNLNLLPKFGRTAQHYTRTQTNIGREHFWKRLKTVATRALTIIIVVKAMSEDQQEISWLPAHIYVECNSMDVKRIGGGYRDCRHTIAVL